MALRGAGDSALRPIRLVRIAHVYYTHKDIEKAREFLQDFGFQEARRVGKSTYYSGTGPDPFVYCAREGDEDEFGGAAFVVESIEELEYASKTLPDATEVYKLDEAPGGGYCVTFKDPVDGFPFHLVCGQDANTASALPQLRYNFVRLITLLRGCHLPLTRLFSPWRSTGQGMLRRGSKMVSDISTSIYDKGDDVTNVDRVPRSASAGSQIGALWNVRDRLCEGL